MSVDQRPEIENLLAERRTFRTESGLHGPGQRAGLALRGGGPRPGGLLGAHRPGDRHLAGALHDDPRVGPAVREVVRRREAEHQRELRRPARRERPRREGRLPLDRRAGRHPDDHLRRPPARGLEDGQRAARARHRDRRPGRDLHADDPRAADRDARLRPDRRAAYGRVRRLLRGGALRPDQRRAGEARHHRRRRLAARQGDRSEAGRRRGRPVDARRSSTSSSSAAWATHSRAARRWRPAATSGGTTSSTASPTTARPVAARQRAHALPALHVGHDRQAEGHHPHDRGLPRRHVVQPLADLRHQAGRRVLVRRRHRLGHRPQLHRLRPARQRDDRRDVRGHAGHPGLGPLVADHRGLQGHGPVLRADGDPGVHEAGRRPPGEARPVVPPRPRLGRRADQPRGVALVPRAHRRRQDADRRHVVADRDRPDPDHAAARA